MRAQLKCLLVRIFYFSINQCASKLKFREIFDILGVYYFSCNSMLSFIISTVIVVFFMSKLTHILLWRIIQVWLIGEGVGGIARWTLLAQSFVGIGFSAAFQQILIL